MVEGSLRGTRLGANSYENESYVEYAARQQVRYDCAAGHTFTVPMSLEAEEIPFTWECRCGLDATLHNGVAPEEKNVKVPRTHWDMLLERRSLKELEALLEERLELLHGQRSHKKSA
jgi:hypothetical protein